MDSATKATEAFMKALARVLSDERKRLGVSQTELAARAGLSRPHVGYLETLKRQPSVESLKRLALAFGTDVSELTRRAEKAASKKQ